MVALRSHRFITKITSSSISGLVLVTIQTHFPTFVRRFSSVLLGAKSKQAAAHLPTFCTATFRVGRKKIPEVVLNVTGFL